MFEYSISTCLKRIKLNVSTKKGEKKRNINSIKKKKKKKRKRRKKKEKGLERVITEESRIQGSQILIVRSADPLFQ